ncbi:organic cation transporter protein-like [Branchiostoma floridae]|uniref:Organic cation transporter protein-like n=1 Tax=Branchiostoma floridae TaxID=7739 RepID=A0A9J7L4V8_BRAFL|nr:organic cation transporter protein-like [Branchiostoma floridae]
MELDEALILLGDFGLYQTIIYVLICVSGQFTQAWHMLSMAFLGGLPEHHCKVPGVNRNHSIPSSLVDGREVYSQCSMYKNFSIDNSTVPCENGWEYSFQSTIVTEWDLVCDKSALVETSESVFMVGVMVGSLIFGQLSDHFGRLRVWIVSIWLQMIFGVGTAFAQDYYSFTILKFITGALEQGVDLVSYVMATEMFSPARRSFAGVLTTLFWASGIMSLALLAYLLPNWRHLQLLISLFNIIALPYWWVIPESSRWLVSRGRISEAEEILQKAARFNNKAVPSPMLVSGDGAGKYQPDLHQVPDVGPISICGKEHGLHVNGSSGDSAGKKNLLDLFRTPRLRKVTLIMMFVWWVNSLVYYGLSLNTDILAGDKYVNIFISGAVEIPAYIISSFVIHRWGRRLPLCLFHVVGGVSCALTIAIPTSVNGVDLSPLVVTLAMLGKFGIAASYAIVFLYATELFPTVVRNVGVGVSSFSSRVGGIIAPFAMYLERVSSIHVPLVLFGVLSILAGLTALLLTETKGRKMPQTIDELEDSSD